MEIAKGSKRAVWLTDGTPEDLMEIEMSWIEHKLHEIKEYSKDIGYLEDNVYKHIKNDKTNEILIMEVLKQLKDMRVDIYNMKGGLQL